MPAKVFIDGKFVEGSEGKVFDVIEPHNNQLLEQVCEASVSDVDRMVQAAVKAYRGGWANPNRRSAPLF
jgi:acyl-CoA reductase-like NAD-dependent aldehyde dehydrogenase